ncbi:agmatine deiminase family protein [Roseisolibacter sp. H3M3-2]|uniref:agmatine deiminase family protein n=1 Tax=Roseisolibacter sp. H3M3-2 TaxID=3031323 RepID=UPI0023DB5BF4|nr:agmatine deiminase family protein [Roseisolibacter sp. H3M3-2]MDF1502882.1 agmatine deiminase family protein [Roseisolibacter sp. H3M3-2]
MPAEWERHDATWLAWPHHEPDWPGKLGPIPWVYAEIVRALHAYERVEVLCHDETVREAARQALSAHGVREDGYRLHLAPNDRVWVRDSGPTGVLDEAGRLVWVNWDFNAWAKYDNYARDVQVGRVFERASGAPRVEPARPDRADARLVLEGGGIEANGQGLLLVTEEWLLSDVQVRNPGLGREDYERAFRDWLGVRQTIWLGEGCVGDDTHGHVDDIARFVSPDTVVLAYEEDPADENHRRMADNLRRLELAGGARGALRVVKLPFPRAVEMQGERLPASYANFYVGNGVVLVPTFNDRNDRVALNTLAELMPDHHVVGIHAVDLVWGLGTLHCLTQQQPAPQPAR